MLFRSIKKVIKENPKGKEPCNNDTTGRQFMRQDSGQTTVTIIPKEDEIREPLINKDRPSNFNAEVLENFYNKWDSGETLLKYLRDINSPLAVGIRPILPMPIKPSYVSNTMIETDFFIR